MIVGFNEFLTKDVKENLFIPYYFSIGHYKLSSSSHAKQEVNLMLDYRMTQGRMKNHDPLGLVVKHCATIRIHWPYPLEIFKEELIYQGIDTF